MPTQQLATFVSGLRYEDLPAWVVDQAKRCLLDYVGLCIGASAEPAARLALEVLDAQGGEAQATVIGFPGRRPALHAALVNGILSHVLDYDDTHIDTIIHPTGPLYSAVLPIAEWRGASGRDVLTAFVAGFEAECRIGLAIYPDHYDVGWHITGTAGTFGAAAAAARLLELDATQTAHALGMAGAQASGLREMFGTMTKSLHVGKAAMNGVLSALLARRGFTSSLQVLEAPRGFCHVQSTKVDLEAITSGLGERFELARNAVKPYACGVVTHPSIDAARRLRERGIRADQVEAIEARVHPLVLELCGKRAPRTGLEGKFSISHCIAVGLIDGTARPGQFTDEAVRRPEVVALASKVSAAADPGIKEVEARVLARLRDGSTVEEHVIAATGTPDNPISDEELEAKYRDLVQAYLPAWKVDRVVELVRRCEDLDHIQTLMEMLQP